MVIECQDNRWRVGKKNYGLTFHKWGQILWKKEELRFMSFLISFSLVLSFLNGKNLVTKEHTSLVQLAVIFTENVLFKN